MTSEKLKITQNVLETLMIDEIKKPMSDYYKLKILTEIVEEIDRLRRDNCNQILDVGNDDIPF